MITGAIGQRDFLSAALDAQAVRLRPISSCRRYAPKQTPEVSNDRHQDAAVYLPEHEAAGVEAGAGAGAVKNLEQAVLYTSQGLITYPGEPRQATAEILLAREQFSLSEKERQESQKTLISDLRQRDLLVRQHEQIHKKYLGQYAAGGIQYNFTVGPDGFDYAMSGSVPVDLSKAQTPEETIIKARTIRKAALAPDHLSTADRVVAAKAARMEREASSELSVLGYDSKSIAMLEAKKPQADFRQSELSSPLIVLDPGDPIG